MFNFQFASLYLWEYIKVMTHFIKPKNIHVKTYRILIIVISILSSQIVLGQNPLRIYSPNVPGAQVEYLSDGYFFHTISTSEEAAITYNDVEGSPYLNNDFTDGIVFLSDTTAVKLPLRYNIYADEMEYKFNGVSFTIGNPQILNKILLGESIFVYIQFMKVKGYFEILEYGKCIVVQKRSIKFNPAEGPKPIEGKNIPPRFTAEPDKFYAIVNDSQTVRIKNLRSLKKALSDQKIKIESFIKQEKIKRASKENIIKIVKYYNSLQ